MIENIKTLYRKIFYHWRAKYLCRLGFHFPNKDERKEILERYTSYMCINCACVIPNVCNKCLLVKHKGECIL